MNSDIQSLVAIMRGFRNGHETLEAMRIKEIRESDIRVQLPAFGGAFESGLTQGLPRKPYGLSKALRVYFGVEK